MRSLWKIEIYRHNTVLKKLNEDLDFLSSMLQKDEKKAEFYGPFQSFK